MRSVALAAPDDFEGWRDAARALAAARVPPGDIVWQVGEAPADLFGDEGVLTGGGEQLRVPRRFVELAREVILHGDPERFALLYTLLTRALANGHVIEDGADPLVRRLETMAKAVRRDIHKMRAFLRFREVPHQPAPPPRHPSAGYSEMGGGVGERAGAADSTYVAWFEPEHHIVRANARFFVDRFNSMRWSILTPEVSLHWDGATLSEGPGATKEDAPQDDPTEAVWKTYYASIFNPARLKTGAMLKEMPRKYWKNMPETALVGELIKGARAREVAMVEQARTAPPRATGSNSQSAWAALREEAAHCTRCHLYEHATQTVFGEGPVDAALMLVGEQPGDQEDLAGRPFIGPAGQVLDRALAEAGIDRGKAYLTNAVKHFKFEQRGKRRIHAKPDAGEISACRWWIEQERLIVRPQVTIALGATAARSLLGRTVTISRERGSPIDLPDGGGEAWITVHPSFLLRIPEEARKAQEYEAFVADLKAAAARLRAFNPAS
ncbi:UdgX family uracil-DNA binding protein [Sphingomonas turrisvirgatae]|uniref:Type-4 uracil-DNA glycosylase n=1 Tax=Sphingomonas turrisvirgatae TaxID=1888892 RepID=A0A1E3LWN3_9SPHN|nr:UdgX family uracil-DNA binding protein [Sphingomonas turrisvirgatae]ODP38159.1 uracil-DNA glycosylase [Sphingomonas turrisvirgatae]